MSSPTVDPDPIALLRAERPDVHSVIPTKVEHAPPAPIRSRRSRLVRPALVASVACAVVLSGIVVSGHRSNGPSSGIGISTAEARDRAFNALEQLSDLRQYKAEFTVTAQETSGQRRADESVVRVEKSGDDYRFDRTWESDFLDHDAKGLTELFVDGLHMEEAASSRYPQAWMLEATPAGAGHARFVPGPEMLSPPDFRQLVSQLERERLVTGQRNDDGTVVVELRIDASKLMPVGNGSSRPPDPIATFAQTLAMASNLKRREAPMALRVEVREDGTRIIQASGEIAREYANGAGGTPPILSKLTARWTWREDTTLQIASPSPADVLVVGNIPAARKGVTGPEGSHGTLSDYTRGELRELGRRIAAHRQRSTLAGVRSERASTRKRYPQLWIANKRFYEVRRAEIERDWLPIDRTAMSKSDRCSPFWPDSLRAMDRASARANPEHAGWRCVLRDGHSSISVLPGDEQIDVEAVQGSGMAHWIMPTR